WIAALPSTMRVGTLLTLAMCALSDDLEIPLQLPLRHGAFELPALPFPRPDVMVDERLAQQLTCLLRFRKPGRGFAQRGGQRLAVRLVAVALRLRRQRKLVLDAVQAARDRRGHRDV